TLKPISRFEKERAVSQVFAHHANVKVSLKTTQERLKSYKKSHFDLERIKEAERGRYDDMKTFYQNSGAQDIEPPVSAQHAISYVDARLKRLEGFKSKDAFIKATEAEIAKVEAMMRRLDERIAA